ncbi:MAG TPA: alpha/beta hydrolase [Candidatus Acidoferrum sp.]|nr:alpha/beta hydrolase [Candidatus Acidoferrum sp.]
MGTHQRWRKASVSLLLVGILGCGAAIISQPKVFSQAKIGEDRFVQIGDHTIHFVEVGEGPAIVLIPGAFTTYRTWDRMLPDLASSHRVLAVDYVGVGDSDKPEQGFRYTIEEQADVMAEMIGTLRLSSVNVVGASYGASIALNLAARYPELLTKVVCIEGGALITPEVLNFNKLGAVIEWPIVGDITWGFMKSGLFDEITAKSMMGDAWGKLTPEAHDEITRVVSANLKTTSRSSWNNIYHAITTRIDFIQALVDTRVPILYFYGEDSKYRAVVDMNIKNFKAITLPVEVVGVKGGTHELHLQYPHEVARIILRFLGREPGQHMMVDIFEGPETPQESGPVHIP